MPMGPLDKALLHLDKLHDALDLLLIPGLIYLVVRGWKHLKGVRFGVLSAGLVCAAYVGLFSVAATGWVQQRYYRPIIPFAAMLAALGYYCFALDVRNRRVLYGLTAVVLVVCCVDVLHKPIRAHRYPQIEAGRWLKRHDPGYDGLVVSDYTIPVLYADMKYFDPKNTEQLFRDMVARGYEFRYIILDGDEGGAWYREYALENGWILIYRGSERNIRIFKSPRYGEE